MAINYHGYDDLYHINGMDRRYTIYLEIDIELLTIFGKCTITVET